MTPAIKVSADYDYKTFPEMNEFDVGPNRGLAKRNPWSWVMFLLFGESHTAGNKTHRMKYRKWKGVIYVVRISDVS